MILLPELFVIYSFAIVFFLSCVTTSCAVEEQQPAQLRPTSTQSSSAISFQRIAHKGCALKRYWRSVRIRLQEHMLHFGRDTCIDLWTVKDVSLGEDDGHTVRITIGDDFLYANSALHVPLETSGRNGVYMGGQYKRAKDAIPDIVRTCGSSSDVVKFLFKKIQNCVFKHEKRDVDDPSSSSDEGTGGNYFS